jgi:hypothetical protein
MGTPYASIKMVGNGDRIIGYGLQERTKDIKLDSVQAVNYVMMLQEAILLRPKLSMSQLRHAINWVQDRLGMEYDTAAVRMSPIRRILGGVSIQDLSIKKPMFCSNLLAYAFLSGNAQVVDDPENAWPVDFVISPNCTAICRIDTKN